MLRVLVASVLVLAAVPALAAAQPASTPPTPAAGERYDPGLALALSVGGTVVGYAAMYASVDQGAPWLAGVGAGLAVIGPSAGHWYTGHYFTRGLGARVIGAAALAGGAALYPDDCGADRFDEPCPDSPGAVALIITGVVLVIAGTVDDVVTAPGEARRRNRRAVAFAPIVAPDRTGVALVGTF